MQKLYLCRHGETQWTISGRHTGKTDLALTENGVAEAAYLRKRLQGVSFAKVFTSPRLRAKQTCQGMHAVEEPLIAEWDYGDYEGITTEEIHKKNPSWNLFSNGAPNGENVEQVGKRADQFLKSIRDIQGNVAIFSHGHFLRVLAARFLGLGAEEGAHLFLSVASIGILGLEHKTPVILLWNETA